MERIRPAAASSGLPLPPPGEVDISDALAKVAKMFDDDPPPDDPGEEADDHLGERVVA